MRPADWPVATSICFPTSSPPPTALCFLMCTYAVLHAFILCWSTMTIGSWCFVAQMMQTCLVNVNICIDYLLWPVSSVLYGRQFHRQHFMPSLCLGVVHNCHHFHKRTQRILGRRDPRADLWIFSKMSFMVHCDLDRDLKINIFKVLFW